MSHKLYDITLYYPESAPDEVKKRFAGKSHVITDLYVHFLNGYKPPKTSRISVTLGKYHDLMDHVGSILTVHYSFDGDSFWKLSEKAQNQRILDIAHEVAMRCCDNYNWDRDKFETAYQRVIEADFQYEVELKHKRSPRRKNKACLTIEKNGKCAIISVLFMDTEGNRMNKVELFQMPQNEMFYGAIVKKNRWFGDQFGIAVCEGELRIVASIGSTERVLNFMPNKYTRQELEKAVKRLTCPDIRTNAELQAWTNGELEAQ